MSRADARSLHAADGAQQVGPSLVGVFAWREDSTFAVGEAPLVGLSSSAVLWWDWEGRFRSGGRRLMGEWIGLGFGLGGLGEGVGEEGRGE